MTLVVVSIDVAIVDVFLLAFSVHQNVVGGTEFAVSGILGDHALIQICGEGGADAGGLDGDEILVALDALEEVVVHGVVLAVVQILGIHGEDFLLVVDTLCADPVILVHK